MKISFEENLSFNILALFVLVVFYSIYLIKQWSQKRRGIQTMQIGRRKDVGSHRVETLMGIITVGIIPIQLSSIIFGWSHLGANARFTGFCVGLMGDLIFLVSVLSMKDSWRAGIPDKDKTKLVTDGIYAYSRNPAFLGFDLQYIGVLLMCFNVLTMISSLFAVLILHVQILEEKRYLIITTRTQHKEYTHRL